jgi:hypothetical protein
MRYRAAAVLLPCAAAFTAGCGTDAPTVTTPVILDTKRVEQAIEASILDQRKQTAEVDCPSGVHQTAGLTFRCVATGKDGTTAIFVVRQTDNAGHVTYDAP